jgi:hypothetical protein
MIAQAKKCSAVSMAQRLGEVEAMPCRWQILTDVSWM